MGGAGGGSGTRSRNIATPITPTSSGLPVRLAYELPMEVNSKAAICESILRQPVMSLRWPPENT
nr:hypothetical protein [Variovorax paradoxus]